MRRFSHRFSRGSLQRTASSRRASVGRRRRAPPAAAARASTTIRCSRSAARPFTVRPHGLALKSPIVGMATTADGKGYWVVAADGGVFSFNAPFFGALDRLAVVATGRRHDRDAERARLLDRRRRRWRVPLRRRQVLRLAGGSAPQRADQGAHRRPARQRLLVVRGRRRRVLVRHRRVPRLHRRDAAQRARRRHGRDAERSRLLARRGRRRDLLVRHRALLRLDRRDAPELAGRRHGPRRFGQRLLARGRRRRRVHLRRRELHGQRSGQGAEQPARGRSSSACPTATGYRMLALTQRARGRPDEPGRDRSRGRRRPEPSRSRWATGCPARTASSTTTCNRRCTRSRRPTGCPAPARSTPRRRPSSAPRPARTPGRRPAT